MAEQRRGLPSYYRGHPVWVPVDWVTYFQADSKYVAAHHPGGELLLSEPLKALEEEFSGCFLRIHRSTLVRIDRIVSMRRERDTSCLLTLEGIEDPLPVARRHAAAVRRAIAARKSSSC